MRVISISVDGIHNAAQQGLFTWLASQDAEVICLQDLRASSAEIEDNPEFQLPGYFSYFLDSSSTEHNGVAIYSRHTPKAIMYGFGFASGEDTNGRYIQADFDTISIGSLIIPDAHKDADQQTKDKFLADLHNHLIKVANKRRSYIICGNWQMVHTDTDVENIERYRDDNLSLTKEQEWLDQVFNREAYADAFRLSNKDPDEYTWWPSGTLGEGDGWRTDLQIISKDLRQQVEYGVIYKANTFSSHAPVIIDYDLERF